jgi:hypothetical protein
MPDTDPNNPTNNTPDPNQTPELTIETVSAKDPADIDDKELEFLEKNADTLSDEVADKFNIVKAPKDATPAVRNAPQAPDPNKPADPKAGEGEDDIDPEDEARFDKLFQKRIAAMNIPQVTQKVQEQEITSEVDAFITSNATKIPNVGQYRQAMITWMKDPAYSNVPADRVFYAVAGKDLMKIGAKLERQASTKVKETQTETSTARTEPGKKDWSTASKEEFDAERARVLGRPS